MPIQPYISDDYSSGMIDSASVSDSLLPRNAVRKAVNGVFDEPRGAISGRAGSTLIGNNLGTAVLGLANFRDSGGGTNHRLMATDSGGNTYYFNGSTFVATLTGDTNGLKTRFVEYLDVIARLNGTDGVKSWNGSSSWVTSGGALDVGNWPSGTKFGNVFNSRVYAGGSDSQPDRAYYSSIPSGGAISWTSGNGYLDVNPNDGDGGLTAFITNGTVQLFFKRTSLYRWDGSSTFANKVIGIGTPSQECVAAHDSGWVYFFGIGRNSVGAYKTTGGYPQKISLNIARWFEAIPASNYSSIAAFVDDDHFSISVGSITVDGQTYSNAWFVYTISMQIWHIENRVTLFTYFIPYIDSTGAVTTVGGDTAGNVQTINAGTDDNGTPISAEVELGPVVATTRGRIKVFSPAGIVAYSNAQQGLQFLIRSDQEDYKLLGELRDTEQRFDDVNTFRAHRLYPKIIATDSKTPWQFDGFEINNIQDEGIMG